MNVYLLAAAFGGGAFGATIGALPSFIVSGLVAIIGAACSMAGGTDFTATYVAFGSFLGPHIAFAGGAAAAAFSHRRGKLESGKDIITPINKIGDWLSIIVGGAFGALGYLFSFLFSEVCHLGGDIDPKLYTDICALSVVSVGVAARLILGKTGLFGKYEKGEKRVFFSKKNGFITTCVFGAVLGLTVSGIGLYLKSVGANVDAYPVLCFGIAAVGLVFMQMGFAYPPCHHIALPAATAALMSGSVVIGTLVGLLCAVIGDFAGNLFNYKGDSHIDPPSFTLFIMTTIIYVVWA